MKKFFSEHSYDMVRMLLNQIAIGILGLSMALATGRAGVGVQNAASIFAVVFYLFLIYTQTWEIGFRDKVSVEGGRRRRVPLMGAYISLCANSINLLLAVFITLGKLIQVELFGNIGSVCVTISLFIEGMYTGLLANTVSGVALNTQWFMYFLLPIPAILVSGVAYYLGLRDIKFTKLMKQPYPESDRDTKKR